MKFNLKSNLTCNIYMYYLIFIYINTKAHAALSLSNGRDLLSFTSNHFSTKKLLHQLTTKQEKLSILSLSHKWGWGGGGALSVF